MLFSIFRLSKVTLCLMAVSVALAACSARGAVPKDGPTVAPQQPGGFGGQNSGIPRAPQALSTNAPYTFHSYTIPNCNAQPGQSYCFPHGLAVGPDRLYYTLYSSNLVGSVSYSGVMGPQISAPSNPNDIVEGVNGGMYVALYGVSALGELAEDSFGGSIFGTWNDFGVGSGGEAGVASDPNGVLWYAESNNNSVVRMTTYGSLLSRTQLAAGAVPGRIAVGADGNSVYVTEEATNKIAKLDLNGNLLTETPVSQGNTPTYIAAGQDGNMYFTEYLGGTCTGSGYIGKLTSSGSLTMISVPSCGNQGIARGNDGNIWYLDHVGNKLYQLNISTDATTAYALPSGLVGAYTLVSGADGQLWFTTQNSPYVTSFQP